MAQRAILALLPVYGSRWDEKASLLYLLCLKHVDNLGAYSIPSGDRPSHLICLQQLAIPNSMYNAPDFQELDDAV